MSRAVQRSQKRRTAVVVELDSQPALLPALRGWRERRPTSVLPCTALCTSRRRHSDARPRCFSKTVTHWYQAVCLERVSANPYYVRSARGRRSVPIAVPGAAPVERPAEQPSSTTEDAGAPLAKNAASTTGHLVKSGHRSGSSICHRGAGCSLWAIRRTRIRLCVRLCSRSALGVRSAAR